MRSLIFGAGGQIGAHLVAATQRRQWVAEGTWYRRPLANGLPLDLCDEDAVEQLVGEFEPEVIFIAAGMSQVDFAQSHPEECLSVALLGAENVARAATQCDATVVLYTSDQVFGECQHPVDEAAEREPLSVYGQAQAAAENLLRGLLPDRHLIIRTGTVYGPHELPRNAALHCAKRLRDGEAIAAAKDRYVQPTYAQDLADATLAIVEAGETGIIHIVGSERLTEAAFYRQVAFIHGFDCDMVSPVPAAALGEDAPRPNSPWLDRARLRSLLGTRAIRCLGDGLRAMRDTAVERPLRRAA